MSRNIPNQPGVDSRHLHTQLRNLRKIFDNAIEEVLGNRRALDRFLSSYWRENRQFGSRDRRLFSESLFAFFRFYGWLTRLITAEEQQALTAGSSRNLSGKTVGTLLAGAWVLENLPPEPAHHVLTGELSLPRIPDPEKLFDPAQEWRLQRFANWVQKLTGQPFEHPPWELLQSFWSREFLQEMPDKAAYFRSLAVRPPLWLRVQNSPVDSVIKELSGAGLSVRKHRTMPKALAITAGSVNLYTLPTYREGRIEVQDLASQVIANVCAPRPGERWWDCCAGAGGKTLALAELMQRTGKVVAGDIRSYKLEDLKKRARRSAFPNIECRPWDGNKVPPRRSSKFDGILIDAPCSCSGVWRRNPDGRWNTSPEEVREINLVQFKVLENVLNALRPNGVLIYATCSAFEMENAAVIRDFLARHSEFELESFANPLTGELCSGMLQITGAAENCDSMFVARLRKKS